MGQITWRNIDAPDFSQAGRLLEVGTRNISDAFTAGQNLIGQQQQIELANFENARKRNTADIQNQLLGFKTPEEMAAAQEQFTPEALKARFGAAYDQSQINQLVAERPGQLRQDLTSQIQLDTLQKSQAAIPFENRIRALVASGDYAGANKYMQENAANILDNSQEVELVTNALNRQKELALRASEVANQRTYQQGQLDIARAEAERKRTEYEANKPLIEAERRQKLLSLTANENLTRLSPSIFAEVAQAPGSNWGARAAQVAQETGIPVDAVLGEFNRAEGVANKAYGATPEQTKPASLWKSEQEDKVSILEGQLKQDREIAAAQQGVDKSIISAIGDASMTEDALVNKWTPRLGGDVGNAFAYIQEARKVLGGVSPAVLDIFFQRQYDNNLFVDGGTFNKLFTTKGTITDEARKFKETIGDVAKLNQFTDMQREDEQYLKRIRNEMSQQVENFNKQVYQSNLSGQKPAKFVKTVFDSTTYLNDRKKIIDALSGKKVATPLSVQGKINLPYYLQN